MTIAVNRNLSNCENSPKKKNVFRGFNGIRTRVLCVSAAVLSQLSTGHMLISFVFPQFTSFHSVFHSFYGLMNSINWPASSIWVFIAQLGEHCRANAEATGSNPVEAPKNVFFFGLFSQLLKLRFTAMVTFVFPQFTSFRSELRSK